MALTAVVQLVLAGVLVWLISTPFQIYGKDASKGFHVPQVDPLLVVIAVGTVGGYIALLMSSRVRRGMEGTGEAINGLLLLGLPGMAAVGLSVVCAWAGMTYAAEIAAIVVALLLLVQGLELIVNSMRSYAGVEEFDQEPVDLQVTPLVPMLSSMWLDGLKMLAGQSLGFAGRTERGVIARMMPRFLVALLVLAVLVSMVRVVPNGQVAVLERFGRVAGYEQGCEGINANLLQPGLHFTLPWPIDQLVYIPNTRLRSVEVGAEVVPTEEMANVDFEFWNVPHAKDKPEARFITGDLNRDKAADPQLLESFGTVWWRVRDPGKYYIALSHNETFQRAESGGTTAGAINELTVKQVADRALTHAFAQYTAEQAMVSKRTELEEGAKKHMQEQLDLLDCGIEVVSFTINDVHPPYGSPDEAQKKLGPAGAYEDVVAAMEDRHTVELWARRETNKKISEAKGDAAVTVLGAQAYMYTRQNKATEDAAQLAGTIQGFKDFPYAAQTRLLYKEMGEALANVQKIVLGPGRQAAHHLAGRPIRAAPDDEAAGTISRHHADRGWQKV